ncbi:hypothetical protein NDK43_06925 [Neobacillus pocheonensis]|uniref:Uncharacterized protein n=1 Tax=Neobacillus pocheonensis TaxID=363869 RepID=A0ABT0W9K6_9BACI|nr:hypothetical protein [Neobacillus pocheonensis]
MEKEQYNIGASLRVDGFYAVITKDSNNAKVFEQKCQDFQESMQVATREWQKLQSK